MGSLRRLFRGSKWLSSRLDGAGEKIEFLVWQCVVAVYGVEGAAGKGSKKAVAAAWIGLLGWLLLGLLVARLAKAQAQDPVPV
jgi:hypothetical protein